MEGFDEDDERASADGPVSANTTYSEWLKTQPDDVVRDILGPTRFDMYKNGTEISAFVTGGETLTIEQLREKEGIDVVSDSGAEDYISVNLSEDMQKLISSKNVSLEDMNDAMGKEVFKTIQSAYDKYPELEGIIKTMGEYTGTDKELEEFMRMSSKGDLEFNKSFSSMSLEELDIMWASNIKDKIHPEGTTWQSSIFHEIGHALKAEIMMVERLKGNKWLLKDMIDPILESFGLVDKVDEYVFVDVTSKKARSWITNNLSKYSLKNISKSYDELFAEAFSEFMARGENSRPFALAIGRAVMPYLNGGLRY